MQVENDPLKGVLRDAGVSGAQVTGLMEGDLSLGSQLSAERNLALLMADPLGIQDMITAGHRLKTMSGASRALADWDRDLRGHPPPGWATLFAGAGQAVLVGPAAGAVRVARDLEDRFGKSLFGQLSTAWLDVSPADLLHGPGALVSDLPDPDLARIGLDPAGGGGFGSLLARLAGLLRKRKDAGQGARKPAVVGQRCSDCGLYPVLYQQPARRCQRCESFHQQGDKGMENWDKKKLAYLSLDGTGIGELLFACRSMTGYSRLSRALLAAFDRRSIREHLVSLGVDLKSCLILVAGGDDLRMVMPAGVRGNDVKGAFELALLLAEGVEERFRHQLARLGGSEDKGITAGTGLVITRHLDAHDGLALAWKLVRSAKVHSPDGTSALDFELVSGGTPVTSELAAFRQGRVRKQGATRAGALHFQLQMRPFPLEEAWDLLKTARSLLEDPKLGRSTLYNLRAAFDEDPLEGLVLAQYLFSHTSAGKRWRARLGLDAQALGRPLDHDSWSSGWLYRKIEDERAIGYSGAGAPSTWASAVPDLVDLCGLVMAGEA